MYCFQCEQTAKGTGCTVAGVSVAKMLRLLYLQDLLVHAAKGISMYAHRAAKLGKRDPSDRRFCDRGSFCDHYQRRFRPAAAGGNVA